MNIPEFLKAQEEAAKRMTATLSDSPISLCRAINRLIGYSEGYIEGKTEWTAEIAEAFAEWQTRILEIKIN